MDTSLYIYQIEQALRSHLSLIGPPSFLREVCEYALFSKGKRIRPTIVLMLSKALGQECTALLAALGIEFFHTASLIADDLPSMDDDAFRRNQPTTHQKYGEGLALLASYALIAAGYRAIAESGENISKKNLFFSSTIDLRCRLALENATYNTGLYGATGGQFLDLNPSDLSLSLLKQIIHQKTTSLFEISFVYGWLFGGGDLNKLSLVKEVASHFGLAFQIADDIGDMEQDVCNGRQVNIANVFGKTFALKMFHEELSFFLLKIKDLNVETSELNVLIQDLELLCTR